MSETSTIVCLLYYHRHVHVSVTVHVQCHVWQLINSIPLRFKQHLTDYDPVTFSTNLWY